MLGATGVMCNLLPARPLLLKYVPSFAAVLYGRGAQGLPLEQMFATVRIVKGRRGQVFSAVEQQLYLDLYEQTRLERVRICQKHAYRHGERGALSGEIALRVPPVAGISSVFQGLTSSARHTF
jgi:hypothetical protein